MNSNTISVHFNVNVIFAKSLITKYYRFDASYAYDWKEGKIYPTMTSTSFFQSRNVLNLWSFTVCNKHHGVCSGGDGLHFDTIEKRYSNSKILSRNLIESLKSAHDSPRLRASPEIRKLILRTQKLQLTKSSFAFDNQHTKFDRSNTHSVTHRLLVERKCNII